jgi:hypothetical protein
MTLLAQFRRSPRWLVLLVGFATLAVATASLMPHDEGTSEDIDCLVCKADQKPLTELSTELVAEPPSALTSEARHRTVLHTWAPVIESGSPRAPPV